MSIVSVEDCAAVPLKVLWAVISKTIPWMAALIENNEGHIEHMVAVVSLSPPLHLSFSCLPLSPLPPEKRFCQTLPNKDRGVASRGKKRTLSKLFFSFF